MSPALECNAQMHHQMIGGGLGLISANRGVGMGFGYGLNHAYFLSQLWGAGAFVRSSNHSQGITQFGFGLEGLYLADRILPGLSLGAHLGAVKFSGGGFDGDFHVAGGLKARSYRSLTFFSLQNSFLDPDERISILHLLWYSGCIRSLHENQNILFDHSHRFSLYLNVLRVLHCSYSDLRE